MINEMKNAAQRLLLGVFALACLAVQARSDTTASRIGYEMVIHTDTKVGDEIATILQPDHLAALDNLGVSARNAVRARIDREITSLVDLGFNAILALVTQNARNKVKWEQMVAAENSHRQRITTAEPINDFYARLSTLGPLDPATMIFNGISCLSTIDGDTVFYLACYLDRSRLDRVVDHTKFEMVLDTLIIAPYRCNLPNSSFDTLYSFDKRGPLQVSAEIRFLSSWMTSLAELQLDQPLGGFSFTVSIAESDLCADKKFRYYRKVHGEKIALEGESFIVPRSSYRDSRSFGTGDYRVQLVLTQTCDITDSYRKTWKPDYRKRRKALRKGTFFWRIVQAVTSEK